MVHSLIVKVNVMRKFSAEDPDDLDDLFEDYLNHFYRRNQKQKNFQNKVNLDELETFKFSTKKNMSTRLIDIFHYPDHIEIFMDLRDFKRKELNFNLKVNVLSIYSSNNKLFEKINILGNEKVGICENSFYKGVLRIKLKPKT